MKTGMDGSKKALALQKRPSKIPVKSVSRQSQQRYTDPLAERRIKDLEKQVAELKRRLEELRKAKSTLITRREREILHVGGYPSHTCSEHYKSKIKELELTLNSFKEEVDKKREQYKAEIATLKQKLHSALHGPTTPNAGKTPFGTTKESATENVLGKELQKYRMENETLTKENKALKTVYAELEKRVKELEDKLHDKEELSREDEKLKSELVIPWQELYNQWMNKMENKLEHLQKTNQLLRVSQGNIGKLNK